MKFILEKIDDVGLDRILDDFSFVEELNSKIQRLVSKGLFVRNWAVSESKNSYLCLLVETVREDETGTRYLFVDNGVRCVLTRSSKYLDDFQITFSSSSLGKVKKRMVLQRFCEAFSLYGSWGPRGQGYTDIAGKNGEGNGVGDK